MKNHDPSDNKYNDVIFEGVPSEEVYSVLRDHWYNGDWGTKGSLSCLYRDENGKLKVHLYYDEEDREICLALYDAIHEGWELIKGDVTIFPTFVYVKKPRSMRELSN